MMEGTYKSMDQSGKTSKDTNGRAMALTRIKRELRKSTQFKHPFYWASFVLVGNQDNGAGVQS
jgi:CHAT domain-containing protein